MDAPIRSIRLPKAEEHEIILLRRPDGSVIARTRQELEAAKAKEGEKKP